MRLCAISRPSNTSLTRYPVRKHVTMDYQISLKSLLRNKRKAAAAQGVTPSWVKNNGTTRRSGVPMSVVLKAGWRLLQRPEYCKVFVQFQAEKEFFNVLYPRKQEGYANKMRQLSFRITDVCNLRCHTCCQWGDNGYLLDKKVADLYKQEVPTQRYIDILRDVKAHGHQPLLYFWGGEPTMYKGLCDVIEEGARLGMPPTLVTNALNVPKMSERLVDAPLAFIQFSVDGATPDVHDNARPNLDKKRSNFDEVCEGLETLYEARARKNKYLPIIATYTTISSQNYRNLVDVYERFKHRVDMFIFTLAWWIDPESAAAHDEDFEGRFGFRPSLHRGFMGDWHDALDVEVLSQQLKELERRSNMPGGKTVYVQPRITEPGDIQKFFSNHNETFGFNECISIYSNPEIDSNGNLSPCRDYHDYVVGNIKENTVTELWNSPRYVDFRRSISNNGIMPVCTRCCGLMGY